MSDLSEWYIEWDRDRLYVTHKTCNRATRVEQGPGSPLFLDTLDQLVRRHDCVHARYLVVGGRADQQRQVEAYLYAGDTVTAWVHNSSTDRFVAVVQVKGSDDSNAAYRGQYVADRLASGGYAAQVFATQDEANAESVVYITATHV